MLIVRFWFGNDYAKFKHMYFSEFIMGDK